MVAVGIASAVVILKQKRREDLLLLSFPLMYILLLSSWEMRADRYVLPVVPLFLLIGSKGLMALWNRLKVRTAEHSRFLTIGVATVVILLLLAPGGYGIMKYHESFSVPDTRTEAKQWISAHVRTGSSIASVPTGLKLDDKRFVLLYIPDHPVLTDATLPYYHVSWFRDVDYLVVCSFDYSRYAREPERYRAFLNFYDTVRASWRMVKLFSPAENQQGPEIGLYAPLARKFDPDEVFDESQMGLLSAAEESKTAMNFAGKLGLLLSAKGLAAKASQLLRFSLNIDSTNLIARQEYARSLLRMGDLDGAVDNAIIYCKSDPNNLQMNSLVATALFQQGEYDEAEPYLLRLTELNPSDETAFLDLTMVYANRGDTTNTVSILHRYLSTLPKGSAREKKVRDLLEGLEPHR